MPRPLILLLALVFLPFSQNISRAQGDETKIIALENLWNQMQINHDADAMGSLLDGDFVLTDYDGTVFNKGQFLATIRDKSTQLTVEVSEKKILGGSPQLHVAELYVQPRKRVPTRRGHIRGRIP